MEKEQTASSEATLNPYAVDSDNPMDWAKAFLAAEARDPGQVSGEWAELEAAQWFASAMLRTIETEYKIRKELDRKSPLQEVAATAWHLFKAAYVITGTVAMLLIFSMWHMGMSVEPGLNTGVANHAAVGNQTVPPILETYTPKAGISCQ